MTLYIKIFLLANLVWAVVALVLIIYGWWCAYRRKKVCLHKRIMEILTVAAWLFIAAYLFRFLVPSLEPLPVPERLVPWFAFHALVACIPLFGAPLLIWARLTGADGGGLRGHLNGRHVTYGRVLLPLWFFTHAGGIVNYFIIY